MQFFVHFTVEADTLEEAEAAVGTWTVTPGTVLHSILGSHVSTLAPLSLAEGGQVSDGERMHQPIEEEGMLADGE
jgi:hypothetical protein